MVQSVEQVLEERGTRYGVFMGQAQIAQSIHIVLEQGMKLSGKNRFSFSPDQLEAINMIVNKIGRIYNGDPNYSDSWRDIAGYATLVADRLDNDSQKLIEAEKNERDTRDAGQYRGSHEGQEVNTEAASEGSGDDNRPTGQPQLRRLPVRLQVQDGNHISTSETQPGVPVSPRG
jgi:hypothetical protein